jgi:hypothetical protein
MANLRDASILMDFTCFINEVGKIGTCPSFQTPEIKILTEDFRGGGMDGTVEMPFGIDKIEFDFELETYDPQVWTLLGYGPGAIDVPVNFRGYLLTPSSAASNGYSRGLSVGQEQGVLIETRSLVKEIKPGKSEPGKKTTMTVSLVANYYKHTIGSTVVNEIDVFNKITIIGGQDRSARARGFLGFTY